MKVRWIDVNKGDEETPNYRSRLVAKESRSDGGIGEAEELFAGTPPLEALKILLSEAATVDAGKSEQNSLMIADVSRAFFEASARRNVCVELVDEDASEDDRTADMVGHLILSMYGTRDAATNWQEEVAREMRSWGFRRGRYNPCTYHNAESGVKALIHGDDFVSVGTASALKEFRGKLEKRFEIKSQMLGTGVNEEKEGRILNQITRVDNNGWHYEADQRHAELLIEGAQMENANPVQTPGEDEKESEAEENARLLEEPEVRCLRRWPHGPITLLLTYSSQ